jgi:hypothetical protein
MALAKNQALAVKDPGLAKILDARVYDPATDTEAFTLTWS